MSNDGLLSKDGCREFNSIDGRLPLLNGLEKLKVGRTSLEPLRDNSELSDGERACM